MPSLTVGCLRRVDAVELADRRYQADVSLYPVVRVVARIAHNQTSRSRLEAVLVVEAGDTRASHAAPIVVVACPHADHV